MRRSQLVLSKWREQKEIVVGNPGQIQRNHNIRSQVWRKQSVIVLVEQDLNDLNSQPIRLKQTESEAQVFCVVTNISSHPVTNEMNQIN